MSGTGVREMVGSILLATNRPIAASRLAVALDRPVDEVLAALQDLTKAFRELGGEVHATTGGYRLVTSPENAGVVRKFFAVPKRPKITDEALETLYVIMEEGPVGLSRVSEIRKIRNVRGTLQTLVDEGLVESAGREKKPGAPRLYRATEAAKDRFGR